MAKGIWSFFFRRTRTKKSEPPEPTSVEIHLPEGRLVEVVTSPLDAGSVKLRTHKVVQNSPDVLETRHTVGFQMYSCFFSLLGVALFIFLYSRMLRIAQRPIDFVGMYFMVFLCLTFVVLGVGGLTGWLGIPLTVLDRRVGMYWKRRTPGSIRAWARPPLLLESVAAVQICSKQIHSQYGNYTIYQINLVMADPSGERVCLLSHGYLKAIRSDAKQVSDFLGRPLLEHI